MYKKFRNLAYKLLPQTTQATLWLKSVGITNYSFDEKGRIDISGELDLTGKKMDELPFEFGKVEKVNLEGVGLKTLKNFPYMVYGSINLKSNNLESLTGLPNDTYGNVNVSYNHLKNLNGCPKDIYGDFLVNNNQLTTLEGGPQNVKNSYDCSRNHLTNLNGRPDKVNQFFLCYDNELTTLTDLPNAVGKEVHCGNNPIDNFNLPPDVKELVFDCPTRAQYEKMLDLNNCTIQLSKNLLRKEYPEIDFKQLDGVIVGDGKIINEARIRIEINTLQKLAIAKKLSTKLPVNAPSKKRKI